MRYQKTVKANNASTWSQTQLTILPRMQQSLTNAATCYRTLDCQYRLITPTPPRSRRQCRKLLTKILPRTTKRQNSRYLLRDASLLSSPVNYAPYAL